MRVGAQLSAFTISQVLSFLRGREAWPGLRPLSALKNRLSWFRGCSSQLLSPWVMVPTEPLAALEPAWMEYFSTASAKPRPPAMALEASSATRLLGAWMRLTAQEALRS